MEPGPKPRPALVMDVERCKGGDVVSVVYGTSQHLEDIRAGEMAIRKQTDDPAYTLAGLAYDTKFDFGTIIKLHWSTRYFKPPPARPFGNTPKLGTLHPSMMRAAAAAHKAAQQAPGP